jgi:acyl-CoA thioesterase
MNEEKNIKEAVAYARDVVAPDPWAKYLGIELEEVSESYARCSITVGPENINAVERAHGAFIYALVDQAFAVACNSNGNRAVALNVSINYISSAAQGERITAEAKPVSISRKISVWSIQVRGESGGLVAAAQCTAYHK